MLFRDRELYSMTALVNRYTKERVRFVVGLSLLVRVWEYRYARLPGGFLEALSRLLAQNVRIYAYPMSSTDLQQSIQSISATGWQWTDTDGWVSAQSASSSTAARSPLQLCSRQQLPCPDADSGGSEGGRPHHEQQELIRMLNETNLASPRSEPRRKRKAKERPKAEKTAR